MAEADALRNKEIPGGGGGLFVKLTEGNPVKLRILTTDPIVTKDKFGNTKFAFIVWNYTENKAMILNKGASIANEIKRLHLDEDYGADIQKMGIKITTKGQLKETRYSVDPLPNAEELTKEQVDEARNIRFEEAVKNGIRLSKLESSDDIPVNEEYEAEEHQEESEDEDEPVDLNDVPF